jgi:HTH-type transcriptional regulator/antitoxin HigA
MKIKPIRTKTDYKHALERVELLWNAKPHSSEGDEFEILFTLIEAYEREHYPIAPPHPIEAIKFRMDQLGMNSSDLAKYLGYKSRASEILSGKRKLTVGMMRKMYNELGVPAEALLAD